MWERGRPESDCALILCKVGNSCVTGEAHGAAHRPAKLSHGVVGANLERTEMGGVVERILYHILCSERTAPTGQLSAN